jgi:hypothetical protein
MSHRKQIPVPVMRDVLRRHELQVWFLAERLVDVPLVEA